MAGVVVLLLALGGCGGPSIAPTHVSGKALARCRALVDALPARVADQERTATDADAPGATWGDPPIVLRCGVGTPADFDPVAKCQVADGLGWYIPAKGMFDQSADVVMTAISRTPYVEVTLPARDRPPATAMIDLTRVIKAHTTPTTRCS